MLEVLIDDKRGNIFDISDLVTKVSISTRRAGRPGDASLDLIPGVTIEPGYVLRIRYGSWGAFYGYVFTVAASPGRLSVEAYDQTRYLLSKGTYVFTGKKASDIARTIASDYGLRIGQIADTGYVIPSLVEDDQVLLDIIQGAIAETTQATGKLYVFGDTFGAVELWDPASRIYDMAITDDTVIVDFSISRSIDRDTYNKVVLFRDNEQTGRRDTWVAQDSATIAKWGRLTLTKKVAQKYNEAQIRQILDALIKLKNRETRETRLRTLGLPGLKAGMLVRVALDYDDVRIDGVYLTEEVRHDIDGGVHSTDMRIAIQPGGQ